MWVVEASTFESKPYPVVVHRFNGQTRNQAEGYFHAHLKSDSFLRDCLAKQRFGDIECRTTVRLLFRPSPGERWRVVAESLWGKPKPAAEQLGRRVSNAVRALRGK